MPKKLSEFAILLENEQSVYHSGDHVKGEVLVQLEAPMKMRGIRLNFVGAARVYWKKRTTENGRTRRKYWCYYRASQKYFDDTIVLFGKPYSERAGDNPVLPAGAHTYRFEFVLAPSLPCSFEGEVGRIRYEIKATIDKPWKFDHRTARPFTVISDLNLYSIPGAADCHGTESKKFFKNIFSIALGELKAQVVLAQKGFVPGEQMAITVVIDNSTKRDVDDFKLTLKQERLFFGMNHGERFTNRIAHDVVTVQGPGGVPKGETCKFRDIMMTVPPLPPSGLLGCQCIDINYRLMLTVRPSGNASFLEVPLEVIIGTIPIRRQCTLQPTAPPVVLETPTAPPPYEPPVQHDGPPPSYAECISGMVDIYHGGEMDEDDKDGRAASRHHYGNAMWTPSYTYYNFNEYSTQHGIDMTNHV